TDRQTDRQAEGNHGPISLLHYANLLGPSVLIAILVAVTLSSPFGSALAGTKDTQAVRLHDSPDTYTPYAAYNYISNTLLQLGLRLLGHLTDPLNQHSFRG
ncbi:hypothetical protein M433DRAFT_160543, partial [Acidomyces richmondensis BFW]